MGPPEPIVEKGEPVRNEGGSAAALKLENRNQILASQTADASEARQAWFEKRDPVWRDE